MEPAVIARVPLALSVARPLLLVRPPRGFASISLPSSFGGGGGGGRFFGGGGGGGGGGRGGGDSGAGAAAVAAAAAALGESDTADADVILLHVGGMSCGGCAANVKRILESQESPLNITSLTGSTTYSNTIYFDSAELLSFTHTIPAPPIVTTVVHAPIGVSTEPEVASATVDFEKATAAVWTTPEAKVTKDWQKQLGEKLANHLSTYGFQSHLHDEAEAQAETEQS